MFLPDFPKMTLWESFRETWRTVTTSSRSLEGSQAETKFSTESLHRKRLANNEFLALGDDCLWCLGYVHDKDPSSNGQASHLQWWWHSCQRWHGGWHWYCHHPASPEATQCWPLFRIHQTEWWENCISQHQSIVVASVAVVCLALIQLQPSIACPWSLIEVQGVS